MKLEEAIERLDRAAGLQESVQAARVMQRFSSILQEIKYKQLSPDQLKVLGAELEAIFKNVDLQAPNVEKSLNKSLTSFIKFLRKHFTLLPEGYFAWYGMRIGFAVGAVVMFIFIFFKDHPYEYYWPLAGMLLGAMAGSAYDRYCKGKGRTFLSKMV